MKKYKFNVVKKIFVKEDEIYDFIMSYDYDDLEDILPYIPEEQLIDKDDCYR